MMKLSYSTRGWYFLPAEELLGESLFSLVKSRFGSDERLDRLDCTVELHWRNETHPPITWRLKFDEYLGSAKLTHAIEDVLQAELDAANAAAAKKSAARQPEKQHASLAGSARAGRRLGDNSRTTFGGPAAHRQEQEQKQRQAEPPRKDRVTRDDVQRVIDEGYLSASFAE